MDNNDIFTQAKQAAVHLSRLSRSDCALVNRDPGSVTCALGEQPFCQTCHNPRCHLLHTHLYGCNEAYRWGGRYIYYCPEGLVFVAGSVCDDRGLLLGGLVTGPVVMGDLQDTLYELQEEPDEAKVDRIASLTVLSTAEVNSLAEVQALLISGMKRVPTDTEEPLSWEALRQVYELKGDKPVSADPQYMIDREQQLMGFVQCGNKQEAGRVINELLNHIYFDTRFSPRDIKARTVELIVLLSRAAIGAGADIHEILASNSDYIQKIENFENMEQLGLWLTVIVHRFVDYVFDFASIRHSDSIYKAMDYINTHYREHITLEAVAGHVYLSKSYLSRLFKEETGKSIFEYINLVRIEKSKALLRDGSVRIVDIAGLCGFEDQSYFTKVFKKHVGVSPKKYRSHRNEEEKEELL